MWLNGFSPNVKKAGVGESIRRRSSETYGEVSKRNPDLLEDTIALMISSP